MVDRLGSRLGMGTALVLLGVFTFGFSFIVSVPSGIVLQVLMGLAAGADYAACVKLLATWFPPLSRGKALGIPPVLTYFDWPTI